MTPDKTFTLNLAPDRNAGHGGTTFSVAVSVSDRPLRLENTRGAVPFRDLSTDLPPADGRVRPGVGRLPESRRFAGKPYQRPFTRKDAGCLLDEVWEAPAVSRPLKRALTLPGAVLILGIAGACVLSVLRAPRHPVITEPEPVPAVERQDAAGVQPVAAALLAFHAAQDAEAKARTVRHGQALLPVLRQYYVSHPPEPPFLRIVPGTDNRVAAGGSTVFYGLYETADGSVHQYGAAWEGDRCLLDWRSLTGWTGADWRQFLDERPAGTATFCVSAAADDFYSGTFSSAPDWACLRCEDVRRDRPAWVYVRRGSEAWESLPRELRLPSRPSRSPRRITIVVQFPDSPGSLPVPSAVPQLELVRFVSSGWFEPDPHPPAVP